MTTGLYDPDFFEDYDGNQTLLAHGDHWQDLAGRRGVVGDMAAQATGLDWTGSGKDGSDATWTEHVAAAVGDATTLRSAAGIAQFGADALGNASQEIVAVLQQARSSQFAVDPEWNVTDISGVDPDSSAGVFRQAMAEQFSAQLRAQAAAFAGADQDIAAQLAGHASALDAQTGGNPCPAHKPDKSTWRKFADAFGDVVGGTLLEGGGLLGVGTGLLSEPETLGASTALMVGSGGAMVGGAKMFIDGLDEFEHLGD
jgi:hypothetical protein